jgi:hypothetical protein
MRLERITARDSDLARLQDEELVPDFVERPVPLAEDTESPIFDCDIELAEEEATEASSSTILAMILFSSEKEGERERGGNLAVFLGTSVLR